MLLQPDTKILNNKYHIVRLLGEGGMARVWLAEELTFGQRLVALKEPRADLPAEVQDEVAQRYRREVTVCAALEKVHVPHVVRAITAEPLAEQVLLVMEYMPGGDLAGLLSQHPRGLPLGQAVAIAGAVLAALQGAHAHPLEIVHRDVKPSNILFDAQGQAYLGDFGLAQVANTSGSLTRLRGGSVGTPLYSAPEQEKGIGYVTPGADLYALGCVLFEMLTGKRHKRVKPGTRASSLRVETPGWLDEVVEKALAEEVWSRWESAAEMAVALDAEAREAAKRERQAREAEAVRQAELKRQQEAAERERQAREAEAARQAELKRQQEAAERERQAREAEAARQAELKRQQEAAERERQARAAEEAQQAALKRRGAIEFDWVEIPAGPFLMGSDKKKDPQAYDDELPQHTVTLGAYRIGRTPVTNAQYKAFVDATGSQAPQHWSKGQIPNGKENHPVVYVSWQDAQAFCQWAGVRLPTEAEWEKAARGPSASSGDGRIYPWGNEGPDANRCNFNMNVGHTTPVGQYEKGMSPYGVLDLAGNVWEWVSSEYRNYPYKSDDGREDQGSTNVRVLRGGSWHVEARDVRSAYRLRNDPGDRSDNLGFRVASPGL